MNGFDLHSSATPPGLDALSGCRVQLVSKPIVPPYRDGTKCLVRDWSQHFQYVIPEVMGTAQSASDGAPELGPRTVVQPVYPSDGAYAPGMSQNIRAACWMAFRCQAKIWHFVFAPNKRSSQVGRALRRLRGRPTVQTIASPPRSFREPEQLLFGDIVVAQSRWTERQFRAAYELQGTPAPVIEYIPPPCPVLARPSRDAELQVRAELEVTEDRPLIVYPGDLEYSGGADFTLEIERALAARFNGSRGDGAPSAVAPGVRELTVLAYRDKTHKAAERAAMLAERTTGRAVKLARNVRDIHGLIATSLAVVFPVDDLYGKVDVPIILLEAMSLGVPVLVLDSGPLADLEGAIRLGRDPESWATALTQLTNSAEQRTEAGKLGQRWVREHHDPKQIARRYEELYARVVA